LPLIVRAICILFAAHLAFATPSLADDAGAQTVAAEQRFAEVAHNACYRQVAAEISFGGSLEADNKLINQAGLEPGVDPSTLERMNRAFVGLIAQSIIGSQTVGDDFIVLAVGGRMDGCRTILLRKEAEGRGDNAAAKLVAMGWKEAPASNDPDAIVMRRMFVRRDTSGQPILLNLYAGKIPDSDLFLLSSTALIPPNVTLPEGF
jgi:hypothetical protein